MAVMQIQPLLKCYRTMLLERISEPDFHHLADCSLVDIGTLLLGLVDIGTLLLGFLF
jgi:hypothetical protein